VVDWLRELDAEIEREPAGLCVCVALAVRTCDPVEAAVIVLV